MDKRIILAVAGSGKTTYLISQLTLDKRALILTYTDSNYHHLRHKIIQKFGHIPKNIVVETYFTFLYSFCYKPFLHHIWNARGINWDVPPSYTLKLKRTDSRFYIDQHSRLYSNRIAKLVSNGDTVNDVKKRIEKYFDQLFIDEVQDFGGHDFNLLKEICKVPIRLALVGDFYQHTFDTSRDGQVNSNLYKDYQRYQKHFSDLGLTVDTSILSRSFRCPPSVCNFIKKILNIQIESNKEQDYIVDFITGKEEVSKIYYDDNIVKLFLKEHLRYHCYSNNWGKAKGLDNYSDVCIALYPKILKAYIENDFSKIPDSSRNKLYVACTRANQNIYLINEKEFKNFKV